MMHVKVMRAFKKVKQDVVDVNAGLRMHQDMIKRLSDNDKALLARLTRLEARMSEKTQQTKIITRKVTVAAKKTYVGSKSSMTLHVESCPFAKNVKRSNKALFKSKVRPFSMGYKACKCLK